MANSYFIEGGVVHKKDGTIIGRVENNEICDQFGERFLAIKGNSIVNNYGSVIAKVEGGKILSPSGSVLGKTSEARLSFENSNALPDVEIAAAWLPFVKGIK
jgi:hypothetical protein